MSDIPFHLPRYAGESGPEWNLNGPMGSLHALGTGPDGSAPLRDVYGQEDVWQPQDGWVVAGGETSYAMPASMLYGPQGPHPCPDTPGVHPGIAANIRFVQSIRDPYARQRVASSVTEGQELARSLHDNPEIAHRQLEGRHDPVASYARVCLEGALRGRPGWPKPAEKAPPGPPEWTEADRQKWPTPVQGETSIPAPDATPSTLGLDKPGRRAILKAALDIADS